MKRWHSTFTLFAWVAFVFCTIGCDWGGITQREYRPHPHPGNRQHCCLHPGRFARYRICGHLGGTGVVSEGTQVDVVFSFQNTGSAPLILSDVSTSCGCTLAEQWPREPIEPGDNGEVAVRFDSRGRVGANRKEVFVVTNAVPSTTTLVLNAEVIGPSTKE